MKNPRSGTNDCVIVINCLIVIGCHTAGHSVRYLQNGSLTFNFPRSWSIMIAAPVTGLDIEAIQKSVSGAMARPAAMSAWPFASR